MISFSFGGRNICVAFLRLLCTSVQNNDASYEGETVVWIRASSALIICIVFQER